MLQSRTFTDRVLRNARFMHGIVSLFIDEAHCICHWGADFRKKYGSLGKIRAFLPRGTPIVAVTATLTARVRRTIHRTLMFAQSFTQSRFINEGNDRPNISLIVRACEHPLNSFVDLAFIIPPTVHRLDDIPKTYVYVDNIATGTDIVDFLGDRLEAAAQADFFFPAGVTSLREVVRPFNAALSQEYRTEAMGWFRSGDIRVLVCTDAAGMVCNPHLNATHYKLTKIFYIGLQYA